MPQSVLLDWKTIAERDADPLEDVIDIWLRHGENPSWEKLIKAVTRCRKGGGKNVAKKIRKKVEQGEVVVASPSSSLNVNCRYK